MSKLNDYEFVGLPAELIDFKDELLDLINNGKFQLPVVSSVPNWTGKRGEMAWFVSGATGRLYMFAQTSGTTWTQVVEFTV